MKVKAEGHAATMTYTVWHARQWQKTHFQPDKPQRSNTDTHWPWWMPHFCI